MIHVGATTERLLIAAELMELKKPYHDGSLREVSVGDLKNFQNTGMLWQHSKTGPCYRPTYVTGLL